jgi:DNA-nicking Smr family endonuclease
LQSLKPHLRRIPKENAPAKPIAEPPKGPPPIDEEAMFRLEMAGVTPLKEPTRRLTPKPPAPDSWKRPQLPDEDATALRRLSELVSGQGEFDLTFTDEYVEGAAKGLPPAVLDQLRKGLFPVQDYLDLHGLTLNEAETAINEYISLQASLGRSCILIIHGRGHRSLNGIPVLKHNLENLLLRRPIKKHILAFTTARPIDGGLGASYVLLRR